MDLDQAHQTGQVSRYFYIEGIGGISGLINAFDPFFESTCNLNCVYTNTQVIYQDSAYVVSSPGGCLSIIDEQVELNKNFFSIFPVPANVYVRLKFDDESLYFVSVYNLSGELLFNNYINNLNPEVDISFLPAGIYFIHARDRQRVFVNRLVKM